MQINQQAIIDDMAKLAGFMSPRESKYIRNYNRYYANGALSDSIHNLYNIPPSYVPDVTRYGVRTKSNIQKSIIDTMASKLSQLKVRPFFTPVNGGVKIQKTCSDAQIFFDKLWAEFKVPSQIALASKDSLVFDTGVIWVDEKQEAIAHVHPWNYFVDPAEWDIGKPSRVMLNFKQFPIADILRQIKKYGHGDLSGGQKIEQQLKLEFKANRSAVKDYTVYYDLLEGVRYDVFGQDFFYAKKIDYEIPPVVVLYYNRPLKGFFSTSVIDDTYGLQVQIDEMTDRIDAATRTAPFAYLIATKGQNTNLQWEQFSNEPCIKIEYDATLGQQPPQLITPAPISPAYESVMNACEQKAYNLVGVSQLSAQSKKPAGVTSGVALQTLEDVESDRFNILVQDVINLNVELVKIIIQVMPPEAKLLPSYNAPTKWKDIKKAYDDFTVQYSATSSLSRDPATKMEQINKLIEMGFLAPQTGAKLLEMPDLEKAFSDITAGQDYIDYVIDKAMREGDFDYLPIVNLDQLFDSIVSALCRVAQTPEEKYINNLTEFLVQVERKQAESLGGGTPGEVLQAPPVGQEPIVPAPEVAPPVQPPIVDNPDLMG